MHYKNIYEGKLEAAGKSEAVRKLAEEALRSGFGGSLACAGMSIKEAARFLGISRSLTYEEIRAGRLIARKAHRRTIIFYEDALAYLRSLPVIPATQPAA